MIGRSRGVALLAALGLLAVACSDPGAPKPAQSTPIDPATAANVKVTISYQGPVPPPRELNMQSAPMCAKAHPEPVLEPLVSVDQGRLRGAFVWIKEGLEDHQFVPPEQPVVIDQRGCLYEPRLVAVMTHQPVEFLNSDPEAHNVHGKPNIVSSWNFIMSRKGSTRQVVFDRSEVAVQVGCDIHPWMRAHIAIVPHPYYGITSESGEVVLRGLPPREYVLGVWHPHLGTLEERVSVAPSSDAEVALQYPPRNL